MQNKNTSDEPLADESWPSIDNLPRYLKNYLFCNQSWPRNSALAEMLKVQYKILMHLIVYPIKKNMYVSLLVQLSSLLRTYRNWIRKRTLRTQDQKEAIRWRALSALLHKVLLHLTTLHGVLHHAVPHQTRN